MAKEIRTMTGASYVVTMTEAGTVSGLYNAQEIVLVALEQPGQATFQAISNQTLISDDAAIVNPCNASALFVGASTGGVSSGQVEAAVQDAIFDDEPVVVDTPAGSDNATCNYVEISDEYAFEGALSEISYRTADNSMSGMTTEPIWLAVWELQQGSSSNYDLLGVSKNSLTQSLGSTLTWMFDSLPLSGRRLRLVPTRDAGQPEPGDSVLLRCRVSGSSDGSVIVYNGNRSNYLIHATLVGTRRVSRFADASLLIDHADDQDIHITAAERQAWNAKADSSALATKADSSTFTAHTGDTVAHLTSDEHNDLTELLEGGYDDLVENLADDVYGDLIETKTYSSESDRRTTFCELILDVDFSASGLLERVEMPSPDSAEGDWPTTPMWLALYEQIDDDWNLVGVSLNSVVQEVGVPMVWHYSSVRINGNELKFVVTPDATHTEKESTSFLNCRYHVVGGIGQGNSKISCGTPNPNMVAKDINGGLANMSLFYRQRQLASVTELNQHINDSSMHLSLAFQQIVSLKADASVLNSHTGDTVAHLTEAEHSSLTELLEHKTQLLALLSATE